MGANEIKRNGQIYFVHDRVQSREDCSICSNIFLKIGIAYGQMKPSALEDVIHKFLSKNYHTLISTK